MLSFYISICSLLVKTYLVLYLSEGWKHGFSILVAILMIVLFNVQGLEYFKTCVRPTGILQTHEGSNMAAKLAGLS